MARIMIFSDDMHARVEVDSNPLDGSHSATCVGCATNANLVADTHEQFVLEDTIEVAALHADQCDWCGIVLCRRPRPHRLDAVCETLQ